MTTKKVDSTPTALALPEKDKELIQVAAQAAVLEAKVGALIVTDKTLPMANEMLVQLKQARTVAEARRKFIVQPLRAHLKNLDAYFAQFTGPLEKVDKALRDKLSDYHLEAQRKAAEAAREVATLEEKRREAEAKAARTRKATTHEAAQEVVQALAEQQQEAIQVAASAPARLSAAAGSTVAARQEWTFEVVDEALVPREYLEVNEVAVRKAVNAGLREIPGVRIFQRVQLAVGGR